MFDTIKKKFRDMEIKQQVKDIKESEEHMKTHWVRIGTTGWRYGNPEDIPAWLLEKTKHGETGYFKGRTFIYKVVHDGGRVQGDGHSVFYKKFLKK